MKQHELIYTNKKSLITFIQTNNLNNACLVQVLSSDEKCLKEVVLELKHICEDITIQTLALENESNTRLNFTQLSTSSPSENVPSEFEFFQSGPVVIFKRIPKDDCWIVSHVTQSVEQWGYDPKYFLDDDDAVKRIFHKDDMERVRDTLIKCVQDGQNKLNQQYRINKADGSLAWISEYTQIIRNAKSEPIELIGYLVDVTSDKEKEDLYSNIINTTTEGFWLLDDSLKIIDVNYSLCAMLGYTKDEMIGKGPLDFISSRDQAICEAQASLINDISSRIYEISFKMKKGGILQTLTNATTMYDESGTAKTFAFMTDISNQKKIEVDLIQRQEAIEELNNSLESKISQEVQKNREKDQMMYQQSRLASMGEMIGNIAHQWRQPLNIMALVMQDLYISDQLGNLTSKKVEDSYEKSNNLLQYMSQTIDDFRNFFQQGSEALDFSIKEALDSVYSLINTNLSYHHIECIVNVAQDSTIKGGLNEFKQVIINILNNAQEAIESNPDSDKKIFIDITKENNSAVIHISDDGGGIKKGVIEKVFDPYFTTKDQTQGTGLGLYMSKQIIENSMCGSLSVKNIKNGAQFSILIPLKK